MRGIFCGKLTLGVGALFGLCLLLGNIGRAQDTATTGSGAAPPPQKVELSSIEPLLHQLQAEVQELRSQVKELKSQQESAQAESTELRKELAMTRSEFLAPGSSLNAGATRQIVPADTTLQKPDEERITKLEEDQQLSDARIAEQSQTKVESASKYRVRLSGIVLFNTFGESGQVENIDFPQLATPPGIFSSAGSFGASVRQSQIGIQAIGPTIAGARTSADIQFDFAGGFPETQNGVSFGIMRLRTGTVRFDWADTSVVGGQDSLFFAPLSPTSIATLAVPALAYSGNLWSWTPQIRVEHKFTVSDSF